MYDSSRELLVMHHVLKQQRYNMVYVYNNLREEKNPMQGPKLGLSGQNQIPFLRGTLKDRPFDRQLKCTCSDGDDRGDYDELEGWASRFRPHG